MNDYTVKVTLTFYNKFGESLSYSTRNENMDDDIITFVNKLSSDGMKPTDNFKEKYLQEIINHINV